MRANLRKQSCFRPADVLSSADEGDFAVGAAFENFLVRTSGFSERQLFPHNRTKSAVLEPSDETGVDFPVFFRCDAPQREGTHGGAAGHELARIDGDLAAIADDDDAATLGQELQVVRQIYVSEHFENEINAASAGGFQYLFLLPAF
jgi:hypothetical protein